MKAKGDNPCLAGRQAPSFVPPPGGGASFAIVETRDLASLHHATDKMQRLYRNTYITIFTVLWILLFHYESVRHFYLSPLFGRELPKFKFLFPPAGWIMFFSVDDSFGNTEVYGVKDGKPQRINPHDILETRTIGFDNIHRNILSRVLYQDKQQAFGKLLKRKFPYFDSFYVTYVRYPSLTKEPFKRIEQIVYTVQ